MNNQELYMKDDKKIEYVYHKVFGFGKISNKDDKLVTIIFDGANSNKRILIDHPSLVFIGKEQYELKEKPESEDKTKMNNSFITKGGTDNKIQTQLKRNYQNLFFEYIKKSYQENHRNDGKYNRASQHATECVNCILSANKLLLKRGIKVDIFEISPVEIRYYAKIIFTNCVFPKSREGKWYVYVLKRYNTFLKSIEETKTEGCYKKIQLKEEIELSKNICETLIKHFSNGIVIDKLIDMMRLKQFYENDFQKELIVDDEKIKQIIKSIGLFFENKYYIISKNAKDEIKKTLKTIVLDGYIIVYFKNLFEQKSDWMMTQNIMSPEMLCAVVKEIITTNIREFPKNTIKQNYVLFSDKDPELTIIANEIDRVWGDTVLRTYDEISQLLPYIPYEKIKYSLSYSDKYKWNSKDTYANGKFFYCDEGEINLILDFATRTCQDKGSVSFDELPLANVFENNYELTTTAVYDFLYLKLKKVFERKANMLSFYGKNDDVAKQIRDFCMSHSRCLISELETIMKNAIGRIDLWRVIDYANRYMVRIDAKTFLSEREVSFNATEIDYILDDIIRGEFIGLKEIVSYIRFPECGSPWNAFLLESYIRRFSNTYKYVSLSSNSQNVGAIVKKTNIDDYHTIMAKSIAKTIINASKEEMLDYLVEMGFLGKRKYKRIDELEIDVRKMRGED